MDKYPIPNHKQLFLAILKLKNEKECSDFLRDLCTIKELDDLAVRWQIAKLLNEKKLSYEAIAEKCLVSTTTVTRVSHWLNHGMGGYKLVLKRLIKE